VFDMKRHQLYGVGLVGTIFQVCRGECTDDYCNGAWTKTLDNCWTDPTCIRVMNVVHGGDWNVSLPYDSFPAFQKADDKGADAVKGLNFSFVFYNHV
jgi:hypothetical protein